MGLLSTTRHSHYHDNRTTVNLPKVSAAEVVAMQQEADVESRRRLAEASTLDVGNTIKAAGFLYRDDTMRMEVVVVRVDINGEQLSRQIKIDPRQVSSWKAAAHREIEDIVMDHLREALFPRALVMTPAQFAEEVK